MSKEEVEDLKANPEKIEALRNEVRKECRRERKSDIYCRCAGQTRRDQYQ